VGLAKENDSNPAPGADTVTWVWLVSTLSCRI